MAKFLKNDFQLYTNIAAKCSHVFNGALGTPSFHSKIELQNFCTPKYSVQNTKYYENETTHSTEVEVLHLEDAPVLGTVVLCPVNKHIHILQGKYVRSVFPGKISLLPHSGGRG